MHAEVRRWIVDLMARRHQLLAIAFRQRAKFEGWLKFELAAFAESSGARSVCVEAAPDQAGLRSRSDVSFQHKDVRYDVELKTPNSNWRVPGVAHVTRPITKNIAEIVVDARKLSRAGRHGIVAFVLFPVPRASTAWHVYLRRISAELEMPLSPEAHTTQITVPLSASQAADAVVCCFEVGPQARGDGAA